MKKKVSKKNFENIKLLIFAIPLVILGLYFLLTHKECTDRILLFGFEDASRLTQRTCFSLVLLNLVGIIMIVVAIVKITKSKLPL